MRNLSLSFQEELGRQEKIIERGLETFVEVGNALSVIREGKLYKLNHSTFEEYCKERWGFNRDYANKQIRAAQTVGNLKMDTMVSISPQSERQTRPLTNLEPEQQSEVWQRAVESAPNGKVTASHVESTRDEYLAEISPNEHGRQILHQSNSNEWYTPRKYIQAVYDVLGYIDLDPASCEKANQTIKAHKYFSKNDDGLSQEWYGQVFLNPPYGKTGGKSNQGTWSKYLINEFENGDVDEAVLLVNATPSDKWFAPLWNYPICFTNHRIQFYNQNGEANQATHSNCFVYLGENIELFARVFSTLGVVGVRYGLL